VLTEKPQSTTVLNFIKIHSIPHLILILPLFFDKKLKQKIKALEKWLKIAFPGHEKQIPALGQARQWYNF